jgi:hypothetical protein
MASRRCHVVQIALMGRAAGMPPTGVITIAAPWSAELHKSRCEARLCEKIPPGLNGRALVDNGA